MSLKGVFSVTGSVVLSECSNFCNAFNTTKGVQEVMKVVVPSLEAVSFFFKTKSYNVAISQARTCKDAFNFIDFIQLADFFLKKGFHRNSETIYKGFLSIGKGMASHSTGIRWGLWRAVTPRLDTGFPNSKITGLFKKNSFKWVLQDKIWKRIEGVALIAGFLIPAILKIVDAKKTNLKLWLMAIHTVAKISIIVATRFVDWQIQVEDIEEKKLFTVVEDEGSIQVQISSEAANLVVRGVGQENQEFEIQNQESFNNCAKVKITSERKLGPSPRLLKNINWIDFDPMKHNSTKARFIKGTFNLYCIGVGLLGYYRLTRYS